MLSVHETCKEMKRFVSLALGNQQISEKLVHGSGLTLSFAVSSASPAALSNSDAMRTGSALTSSEQLTLTKSGDITRKAVMIVTSVSPGDRNIMLASIADMLSGSMQTP